MRMYVPAAVALMLSPFCQLLADEKPARSQQAEPAWFSTLQQSTRAAQLEVVGQQTRAIKNRPGQVGLWSARGDAWFKLGKFEKAVGDYTRMVELQPQTDSSHWRRGIAYFYAKQYEKAAQQFERYHSFDDIDRENGIWRYLSQHKAYGQAAARRGLLKYRKDDREPFPAVYELFAGRTTGTQILSGIRSAKIGSAERSKREFYAQLYIGLNDAVEGRSDQAELHLTEAVKNKWPRTAGFGPEYMWDVGRLHLAELRGTAKPAR